MFKKDTFFFSIFILYLLMLCVLLFSNDIRINYSAYPLEDKLLHFSAFFTGQLFVLFSGKITGIAKWLCYCFFLMLPAFTEFVQKYLPRRVSDLADMVAAYLGIMTCLGIWFIYQFLHRYFSTSLPICRQANRSNNKER